MSALLFFYFHSMTCFFMTGVIWIIQLIHYPSFAFIEPSAFSNFHKRHTAALGFIAGLTMVAELCTGFLFAINIPSFLTGLNFTLILLIWFCTFFISVPIHNKLASGFNLENIKQLTLTNWYRTALWSLRSILLIYFFLKFNK